MSEHGDDEEDMNEVIEVMDSDEAMEQHSDEEAQGQEEESKQRQMEEEKQQFVRKIKSVEKVQTNMKLDSIESKINQLLQSAEQYASFLLHRHKQTLTRAAQASAASRSRHRVILDEDGQMDDDTPTRLNKQPSLLRGGELKDYQLTGLNWMISLYETGINGILADEMGLGKTIQTIGFIAFLKEYKRVNGPYLIVAPKSTLGNWMKEFKKWMPCCRVVKLIALKEERDEILAKYLQPNKFDVCLTSYEGVNICLKHLRRFSYRYIIIDEAHKIKNEEATISQNMRRIKTNYKLLLSGTPLQNTPHELWSLLNYLLPDLFDSPEVFDKWFEVNTEVKNATETRISQEELDKKNLEMVQKFQKILRPFMLRRTKAEVERSLPPKKEVHLFIKMTAIQRSMYQNIILSNNPLESGEDKSFYMNKLMQLRKICLHPYLFPEVEDKSLPPLGEHLIEVSGKMRVLDKFLRKLHGETHQVLIFTQFTMMLNILEDYCNFREFSYCRIDGDTDIQRRDDQIADFTSEGSKKFLFLLSTRAGGLGINLASADTVIIYDSDFNPQMDLQAMDRAHRIGQKSQVMVYRMACEHTVEEKIIERQQIKLRWDSLMIQQGRIAQHKSGKLLSKDDLRELTMYGASQIFKIESDDIHDDDIDFLLQIGEKLTKEMNQRIDERFKKLKEKTQNLDLGLGQINIFDYFEEVKKSKEDEDAFDEAMALQFQLDNKTRRNKGVGGVGHGPFGKRLAGKQIKLPEHFLYKNRDRLQSLMQKDEDYQAQQKFLKKFGGGNHDEHQVRDQYGNEPLTPEEKKEMDDLSRTGFTEWSKQEFSDFVLASEKFGRNNVEQIAEFIRSKSIEEVKAYKNAFWSRLHELADKEKFVKQIERGEKMLAQKTEGQRLIEEKCKHFHQPRYELVFTPSLYNKFRSKYFSLENDKYLVHMLNEVGYGNWGLLKKSIRKEPMFRFDHAFKCKTESELKNRITSLVKVIEKEKENQSLGRPLSKNQPIEKPKILKDLQSKDKPEPGKQLQVVDDEDDDYEEIVKRVKT